MTIEDAKRIAADPKFCSTAASPDLAADLLVLPHVLAALLKALGDAEHALQREGSLAFPVDNKSWGGG